MERDLATAYNMRQLGDERHDTILRSTPEGDVDLFLPPLPFQFQCFEFIVTSCHLQTDTEVQPSFKTRQKKKSKIEKWRERIA